MSVTVKERVDIELKIAMKARDKVKTDTLRSILSQFGYRRIEVGGDLSPEQQIDTVRKLIKQRNDSISEYQKADRADLVEQETKERDILKELLAEFVPADMEPEAIRAIVRETLAGLDAANRTEGTAMKAIMPQLKGKAEGAVIRGILLEELAAAQ